MSWVSCGSKKSGMIGYTSETNRETTRNPEKKMAECNLWEDRDVRFDITLQ